MRGLVSGRLIWIDIAPGSPLLVEARGQLEFQCQGVEAQLLTAEARRRALEIEIAGLEDGINSLRARIANVDVLQAGGAAPRAGDDQPESEPATR